MTEAKKSLEDQLDVLIRLTALQVLGDRSGSEAIALLGQGGMDAKTIADLVGTTEATVRSRLSKERKKQVAKDAIPGKTSQSKNDSDEY